MLMSHAQKYEAAWIDLRTRTVILLALFLGFVPGVPLISYVLNTVMVVDPLWIAGAWAAAFAGAGFHRATFPCPHCGKWFFIWVGFHNPFSRKCMHCGLKIGSSYEAGPISA
jgi:hypothetical protein